MANLQWMRGVGIGFVAGTAIGMLINRSKKPAKNGIGRAMKVVGDVVESISSAMGG